MNKLKCFQCDKVFKEDDGIMVVDGNHREAVHDHCHYDYISHLHRNHMYELEELKEDLADE